MKVSVRSCASSELQATALLKGCVGNLTSIDKIEVNEFLHGLFPAPNHSVGS